jgi:hypothetical protein
VSPRQIPHNRGLQAVTDYLADPEGVLANADTSAVACRFTLQLLAKATPGRSVEVRVPPFGAVQVIGGPSHTRGTPPAVIEMSPAVWLELATGRMAWSAAVSQGLVDASGHRANLQEWLPLAELGYTAWTNNPRSG